MNQNIHHIYLSSYSVANFMDLTDKDGDNNNDLSTQELVNFINKNISHITNNT